MSLKPKAIGDENIQIVGHDLYKDRLVIKIARVSDEVTIAAVAIIEAMLIGEKGSGEYRQPHIVDRSCDGGFGQWLVWDLSPDEFVTMNANECLIQFAYDTKFNGVKILSGSQVFSKYEPPPIYSSVPEKAIQLMEEALDLLRQHEVGLRGYKDKY